MEALNSAGISKFSLGIGAATTALTAVLSIYNAIEQSHEEMVQNSKQSLDEGIQSVESLEDSLSEYKKLKDEIDSGNLTDSEIYEKKQQIFEIQQSIVSEYGNQAAGIDLVNGKLETQLGYFRTFQRRMCKNTFYKLPAPSSQDQCFIIITEIKNLST